MHIDFSLASIGFALGVFNDDTGTMQPITDLPHKALFFCRLKNMVIFIVRADGRHGMIFRIADGLEGFSKHKKLQLGGGHHGQPQICRPFELLL